MSQRIPVIDPAGAHGHTKDLLDSVRKKYGTVPNELKTMVHSPEVLDGYLSLSNALSHGALNAKQREQIALAVSQTNGCSYGLSAHSLMGKLAGLEPGQILEARRGHAQDAKSQALLSLTVNLLERHGSVSSEQFEDARKAGLSNAEIVEVVGNVALMTLSNYLNELVHTDVDFPEVTLSV